MRERREDWGPGAVFAARAIASVFRLPTSVLCQAAPDRSPHESPLACSPPRVQASHVRVLLPLLALSLVASPAAALQATAPASPATASASTASTQRPPFPLGEALEYRVSVSVGGNVGTGQMRVEGPAADGNASTWRLVMEIHASRGPIRATDRTVSWLDPLAFRITRFEKTERHPLSRSEERVTIHAADGTYRDEVEGRAHALGSAQPLDELSFIYFLRTIPLDRDTVFQVSRHFDPARNPTIIRILGEELVETPVGIFRTRIVEMVVRDPKRFRGAGTIRLNISVADCHVPVRIVSRMPVLGTTTLLLTGWLSPPRYPGALPCEA